MQRTPSPLSVRGLILPAMGDFNRHRGSFVVFGILFGILNSLILVPAFALVFALVVRWGGGQVVTKRDTFNPSGFKQGSFFPKTSMLPEGSTVRYSFGAETTAGNMVVVEGDWVIRTLYSHESRFRRAAETTIIPPPGGWEYRQGQPVESQGRSPGRKKKN